MNKKAKTSNQLFINHSIVKFVASYSPKSIFNMIIGSKCTMILSNVMGPQKPNVFDYPAMNLLFCVPNMYKIIIVLLLKNNIK